MKVGINATCIGGANSGARQRFICLYGAAISATSWVTYVIYIASNSDLDIAFLGFPNCTLKRVPLRGKGRLIRYLSTRIYWGRELSKMSFDIFESLHLPPTISKGSENIVTIHDLRWLYDSKFWLSRFLRRGLLHILLRSVQRVITVSHCIAREIRDAGVSLPIYVVHNGIVRDSESFKFSNFDTPSTKDTGKFTLVAIGHFEPRKNYSRLLDALHILNRFGDKYRLTIFGRDGGSLFQIQKQIERMNLCMSVTLSLSADDITVRNALRSASLFVFPSLYEGFGIPILEAMENACLVAVSDIPPFREICGENIVYFDPLSSADMALKIELALKTSGYRDGFKNFAEKRLRDYDVEFLARELAKLHQEIYIRSE